MWKKKRNECTASPTSETSESQVHQARMLCGQRAALHARTQACPPVRMRRTHQGHMRTAHRQFDTKRGRESGAITWLVFPWHYTQDSRWVGEQQAEKKTKKHTTSNNAIGRSVCLSNAFKSSREQSHRRIWVELSDLQKINCNGMMVDAHGWITWYRVRTTAVPTNGCDGQNASSKSESYLRLRLNLLWWGSRRELSLQLHLLSCQP